MKNKTPRTPGVRLLPGAPRRIPRAPGVRAFTFGPGRAAVARVDMNAYSGGGNYRHPEISIGYYEHGPDGRFVEEAILVMQQHRLGMDQYVTAREARGITRTPGFSGAYSLTVKAGVEYGHDRKSLRRVLDLLDRAEEAHSAWWQRTARDKPLVYAHRVREATACDAMKQIIGLRFAGVDVEVYRAKAETSARGGYGSLAVVR